MLLYSNGTRSTCNHIGFDMGEKFESQCNHLGIYRDINIVELISSGRKTAYALMGAGLHAGDGLTKHLCTYLWTIYMVPRLVYGLEVQKLSRADVESLEKLQRKFKGKFKVFQKKTPYCDTLSPLGIPPIELIIHKTFLICL